MFISLVLNVKIFSNEYCYYYYYDCTRNEIEHQYLFWQENVKYLPGIKLGQNVVADPDLENAGIFVLLFIFEFNFFVQ